MASSHPVGLALFFMFFVASGSGFRFMFSSGLVRDFKSDNMAHTECSCRPAFPFFKDALPLPPNADEHPFLKLTVTRKNSSDLDLILRIFVWPDTGNCNISSQLTNGLMRRNLTFIVETAQYERGLCMTATQEVPPMGNQSVWTLEPSRLEINSSLQ